MASSSRRRGPVDWHWLETLDLVSSADHGNSFVCMACVRTTEKSIEQATYHSAGYASNMYAHFKSVHSDVHTVIHPIIQSRENSKKRKTSPVFTIERSFSRSHQRPFDESLLEFFSSPDVPKSIMEHKLFGSAVNSVNASLKIPTLRTLNSRLTDRFREVLQEIQDGQKFVMNLYLGAWWRI